MTLYGFFRAQIDLGQLAPQPPYYSEAAQEQDFLAYVSHRDFTIHMDNSICLSRAPLQVHGVRKEKE